MSVWGRVRIFTTGEVMLKRLFKAIEVGDKKKVERLLKYTTKNIGKVILVGSPLNGYEYHNALSMCVKYNRMEIYLLLLDYGAKIKPAQGFGFGFYSHHASLYSLIERYKISEAFVRLLMKDSPELNPVIVNDAFDKMSILESMRRRKDDSSSCEFKATEKLMSLIMFEAITRADENTLKVVASYVNVPRKYLSAQSISDYIGEDTRFSKETIERINNVLDKIPKYTTYLVYDDTISEIKKTLKTYTREDLSVDHYPEPLRTVLALSCKDSLCELSTKFLSHVLPKKTTLPENKELNPSRVKQFLCLDELHVLNCLFQAQEHDGRNPAAIYLAQILFYKRDEVITLENDTRVPMFNEEEHNLSMSLLDTLYGLRDTHGLVSVRHQQNTINYKLLNFEIDHLKSQLNHLSEKLASVQSTLDEKMDVEIAAEITIKVGSESLESKITRLVKDVDRVSFFSSHVNRKPNSLQTNTASPMFV